MHKQFIPIQAAVLLLLLQLPIAGRGEETPSAFLLGEQQVGDILIGSTVNEVYRRYGKENTRLVDLNLEGSFSPAIEVDIEGCRSGSPSLIVEYTWWREIGWGVRRVRVRDPRFRTREGAGIGSTFGELKRWYSVTGGVRSGEKTAAYVVVDSPRIWFGFLDRPTRPDGRKKTLPDAAVVTSVMIFGVPEVVRAARRKEYSEKQRGEARSR